jgi:hypothetical protein
VAPKLDQFWAIRPARQATRSARSGNETSAIPIGQRLFAAAPQETRRRYQTVLHLEDTFPGHGDHGCLIGATCQLMEGELDRLLAQPARTIAPVLSAALRTEGSAGGQAEILDRWAAGTIPITLGSLCIVLLALRRGWEQGRAEVHDFLAREFEPCYSDLLAAKGLGSCLDRVRTLYRNPACHGQVSFGPGQYAEFVRLVVANHRLRLWDRGGVDPLVLQHGGVFHHHLSLSRRVDRRLGGPVERWLALATPPGSLLQVGLRVEAAEEDSPRTFRLGDRIRFVVEVNRDAHVLLIDQGTTGRFAVVWPNAWRKETFITAGRPHDVPNRLAPEFDYRLIGMPGKERVKALATLQPLAQSLQPAAGAGFRPLDGSALETILDEVSGRLPDEWAVAECTFDVRP